jgi:hypothetical protein
MFASFSAIPFVASALPDTRSPVGLASGTPTQILKQNIIDNRISYYYLIGGYIKRCIGKNR